MSIFQGDPRLILDKNGLDVEFKDGQPVMDKGLENLVLVSLGTDLGWFGLDLMGVEEIGSRFGEALRAPITSDSLDNIRVQAEAALDHPALGEVVVDVGNPISSRVDVKIRISPPEASDSLDFLLSGEGLSWSFQRIDPAQGRL